MRPIAGLLFILAALSLTARADDSSKRAKLDQLFIVMNMDRTMQQTMDAVEKAVIPMTEQMVGKDVPADIGKQVADLQKQMFALVEGQMGWKAMEPAYVDIYARNFTEDQIDDLIAFYKTPTGAALLEKTPELASESLRIAQAKLVILQPQMQKLIQDFIAQHADEIKRARAAQKSGT